MNCLKCKGPLPGPKTRGRPASYCGIACRRAAEFEIRRLGQRIQELEKQLSTMRIAAAQGDRMFVIGFGSPTEAIPAIEQELEFLEKRLRELLGATMPRRDLESELSEDHAKSREIQ